MNRFEKGKRYKFSKEKFYADSFVIAAADRATEKSNTKVDQLDGVEVHPMDDRIGMSITGELTHADWCVEITEE